MEVQFLAYIYTSHNPKIKTPTVFLSHLKAQKVKEERNQEEANQNLNNSLNHLPLPQKKRNPMKRLTTIIIMRITEVIAEAADHIGVHKVAKGLLEDPNKGEGDKKTIIGANTRVTMDNLTLPVEAITITIITVIIETEVDVAMVVIITEVAAMSEAVTD